MARPPSLGDSARSYVLVDETYGLPKTRKELIDLIERVLTPGGVQKIVVEIGKPLAVKRYVEPETVDAEGPQELPPDEMLIAARNAEIVELPFVEGISAYEQLFKAFMLISQKRLSAGTLLVHSPEELRQWLEVDLLVDISQVYGVLVKADEQLPEDTALLVATEPGSPNAVALSVRMSMNLPTRT